MVCLVLRNRVGTVFATYDGWVAAVENARDINGFVDLSRWGIYMAPSPNSWVLYLARDTNPRSSNQSNRTDFSEKLRTEFPGPAFLLECEMSGVILCNIM
jgi:hypothetical protein